MPQNLTNEKSTLMSSWLYWCPSNRVLITYLKFGYFELNWLVSIWFLKFQSCHVVLEKDSCFKMAARVLFLYKTGFSDTRISIAKIRWLWDHLIFIMGILILVRQHLCIEKSLGSYFQLILRYIMIGVYILSIRTIPDYPGQTGSISGLLMPWHQQVILQLRYWKGSVDAALYMPLQPFGTLYLHLLNVPLPLIPSRVAWRLIYLMWPIPRSTESYIV